MRTAVMRPVGAAVRAAVLRPSTASRPRSRPAAPLQTRPVSTTPPPIDFDALRADLAARPAKAIYNDLAPMSSHLLNIALSDYIPAACLPAPFDSSSSRDPYILPSTPSVLPHGHHLIYFPLQLPPSQLLPDGTDPAQWPGPPFMRRMWAGGSVRFPNLSQLVLDGRRAVCVERLGDVQVRGPAGAEKVFVDVWRRHGVVPIGKTGVADVEAAVEADPAIEERRTLVFMRETSLEEKEAAKAKAATEPRIVKAPNPPDESFTFTPTPSLLFHFSALTYNAHAIHLDPQYSREVEGHRSVLVHGPLTLALMLSMLEAHVGPDPVSSIRGIEYRNLAPLYCHEPLSVCIRRKPQEDAAHTPSTTKWDIWVEGPQGGLAVRGTATTVS